MVKKVSQIAELLPDGLDESTISAIAQIFENSLQEALDKELRLLSSKIPAFIRANVDKLKEQALVELEQEHPGFRNAQLFNHIRDVMSVELNSEDENSAVNTLSLESSKLSQDLDILTDQLNETLVENNKYKKVITLLSNKVDKLEEQNSQLKEQSLNESRVESPKPFKSSEKGLIIVEGRRGKEESNRRSASSNEFLTEDMLRLMHSQ